MDKSDSNTALRFVDCCRLYRWRCRCSSASSHVLRARVQARSRPDRKAWAIEDMRANHDQPSACFAITLDLLSEPKVWEQIWHKIAHHQRRKCGANVTSDRYDARVSSPIFQSHVRPLFRSIRIVSRMAWSNSPWPSINCRNIRCIRP